MDAETRVWPNDRSTRTFPITPCYDGQAADAAIAALRELKGKPFFLGVGFIKPHTPFVAPKKYWDLYDPKKIQLAAHSATLPKGSPALAGHNSGEVRRYTDQPKRDPFTEANARNLRHGYFACISYIDAQVGRVLAELDRLGLRENTIVLLYGDHGWHLGDHGLWGKITNFEIAARAPLIISAPGMTANRKTMALTEFLDIYPTLAELAGLPVAKKLEGRSLVPVLFDPARDHKPAAFTQQYRGKATGYSIRTERRRYTEWIENGRVIARELYDYAIDPGETTNLAAQPKHAEFTERLSRQLRKGLNLPPRFARAFGSHMVLQQGQPLPVWGTAKPAAKVRVTLGDKKKTATADADGNWKVNFPALKTTGQTLTLTAQTARHKTMLTDILVGEVWLCAGQSNMEWKLSKLPRRRPRFPLRNFHVYACSILWARRAGVVAITRRNSSRACRRSDFAKANGACACRKTLLHFLLWHFSLAKNCSLTSICPLVSSTYPSAAHRRKRGCVARPWPRIRNWRQWCAAIGSLTKVSSHGAASGARLI